MQSKATTTDDYIAGFTPERKDAAAQLRKAITDNLPNRFKAIMAYGMQITWYSTPSTRQVIIAI